MKWRLFAITTKGLEFVCQQLNINVQYECYSWSGLGKVFIDVTLSESDLRNKILDALHTLKSINHLCALVSISHRVKLDREDILEDQQISKNYLDNLLAVNISRSENDIEELVDWDNALEIYGKLPDVPTFRVNCLRDRNYAQVVKAPDIERMLGAGVVEKFGWKVDCKNYKLEVYSELNGSRLIVGLTLRDTYSKITKRYRHPDCFYKTMLNPALAFSLLRLCELKNGEIFCDPMCGTGTLAIEAYFSNPKIKLFSINGDLEEEPIEQMRKNIQYSSAKRIDIVQWDASLLTNMFREGFADVVCSDLPFGHRCSNIKLVKSLYTKAIMGIHRILCVGGRAVLLVVSRKETYLALESTRGLRIDREIDIEIGISGTYKTVVFLLTKTN
jgi:23S rRNA G2445 N2-methylase RlmL